MASSILLCVVVAFLGLECARALEPFEPGWLNGVGGSFDFKCPKGQAITRIRSTYTHRLLHRDRKWSFKCEPAFRLDGEDYLFQESFDSAENGDVKFVCSKGFLVGVSSQKPGKSYYRTFRFSCLYVRPRNIISCHHFTFAFGLMEIPTYGESNFAFHQPITGIQSSNGYWNIRSNELKGCICQPGFKGKNCLETCSAVPCPVEETRSAPGKDFDLFCPENQIVSEINYQMTENDKSQWNIKCRHSPLLHKEVKCYTKYLSHDKNLKCNNPLELITGIAFRAKMDEFGISCCTGLPAAAESCTAEGIVGGSPFNPEGGSFTAIIGKIHPGLTALHSRGRAKSVWTPTYPEISCKCDNAEKVANVSSKFVSHESGFVLGGVLDQKLFLWRITLNLKDGNDFQLWNMKNGFLVNGKGLALDMRKDGLIIAANATGSDTQRWRLEDGRLFNPKLKLFVSTFGLPREGMHLTALKTPTQMDAAWKSQIVEQTYLCRDSCWKKPCKNGGKCVKSSMTGFECNCPAGFQGRTCEENVDECIPSLCQNGAKCLDQDNDYQCSCPPGFVGKDCDIPKKSRHSFEDVRCVDLVDSPAMKSKVGVCHSVREGIKEELNLETIFKNLIALGYRINSPLQALKMIAASSKLRTRFENYPLKCIREGHIKDFTQLQSLMEKFGIKVISESVQTMVKTAVQFFKSPIEGERGILQLISLQGGTCGKGPCTKEDVLGLIATSILPEADTYDGCSLNEYRGKQDFC